jgi:hypothetical protein
LDLQIDESEQADDEPFSPPEVTLPPETEPSSNPRPGENEETTSTPRTNKSDRIQLSSHETAEEGTTTDPVDAHVTHIVVQAWQAQGKGFDGEERDADLLVCVEPRNADGDAVPLGSQLSLVVLDASQTGEGARVARWDYTASEARRLLKRSPAGHGIHLELPWPDEVPTSDDLHIFARYITVEDEFLEADARVQASYLQRESVQRTGWHRAATRPSTRESESTHADGDSGEQLTRPAAHKIKLRPIPKSKRPPVDRAEINESTRPPLTEEQPTILLDEDVPVWRPER